MNHELNFKKIKKIIFKILEDEKMKDILYLSGGVVFYLVHNIDSNRQHEDIDFILDINNMPYVRDYLKKNHYYNQSLDSLFFENGILGDYGVKAIIENISISFSPYIIKGNNIYQRIINSKMNHKEARMYDILVSDYIEEVKVNNISLKINTVEFMKAIKEIPNREKDKYDIELMIKFGYNREKYERNKVVLNKMDEIKHKVKFIGLNHMFIQDRLRISITNICNMSCYYCHNEGQGHSLPKKFITLEYIDKLVDFIIKNNIYVKKVNITGGEPLLHSNVIDIIHKLSTICKDIKLNTNGVLLDENKIIKLSEAGLTSMNIGIDSLWNKQSKPSLYDNKYNLDDLKTLIFFARKYFQVSINTVISYYNYNRIDDMIDFSITNGLYKIKLIELIDFDFWKNNCTNAEKSDYFKKVLDIYSKNAKKIIYYKDKGRYDVILKNNFLIRFGEDYCKTHACGNLYSIINANMEYVCCQKSGNSKYVDFEKSFEEVYQQIMDCHETICNNKCEIFPRDTNGNLISITN